MKPEEWVSSTHKRWDSGHLYEGAQHLAAALEEIARLQAQLAQAERVVVPECGYRFNTHCLCAIPSSRVLKDGEVAVQSEYFEALENGDDVIRPYSVWLHDVFALRAQGKEGAT